MYTFATGIAYVSSRIVKASLVRSGYWQGISTAKRPEMSTHEMLNFTFHVDSTNLLPEELVREIKPDLPWADDHFAERVSRKPLNPPPSEAWWPYAPKGNSQFKKEGIFSHTYPERYWPMWAGDHCNHGIRFIYGDLDDLVNLLRSDPLTRQAYFPVWFPEDLGAPITERKPCTLGYHFIMRDNQLHIVYFIRSCDFYRHFRNDVYLTVKLQHWVLNELRMKSVAWDRVVPGSFTMHITSLHLFVNDVKEIK
jgi:thymidylate synthase